MIPDRVGWTSRVPEILRDLEHRWSLTLGAPYQNASCAWVAPEPTAGDFATLYGFGHADVWDY